MKRIIHKKKRKQAKGKAAEDISYLLDQAKTSESTNSSFSKKCIALAKKMSSRYKVPLKKEKHLFCNKCHTILIPGKTAQVRIKAGKNKIKVVTCLECGTIKRFGLSKEE
jgi:ribonuclease P protein subunit RPR2